MSNFFNLENPVFVTLSRIFDLIFISIVYLLVCLPVITIGPANTALYYAVVKVIRKERGYLLREFFKSFRQNFKRGAIAGIIMLVVNSLLVYDVYYALNMANVDNTKGSIFLGVFIAFFLLAVSFNIYAFPILSRFEMTVKQLIKASVYMSMRHLLSTILMVVIVAASVVAFFFVPLLIMILPGVATLLISLLMERVFRKYMPESEGPGEETGKDEWYLE
jgi:uncharacterized membrane protein YesL